MSGAPAAGAGPGSLSRAAVPRLKCPDCGCTDIDYDPARGDAACVECGTVLEENAIVAEVTFQEDARGRSAVVGQHVRADGKPAAVLTGMPGFTREATEVTMAHGRRRIWQVVSALRLNNHHAEAAMRLFRLAVERNFHKGRRMGNVCCACLYVICRLERTPHMLIDFSDVLETNLFVLGNTFLKFARLLNIDLPVIDPSLYIYRFAAKLEFGDKTHAVAMTALRIVARMKRDWISHGRRPSGLCGAALIVSARMHNFYRSQTDVVRVVRVGVGAVRDRLLEFDQTAARNLTVGDIDEGGGDEGKITSLRDNGDFIPVDPPAFRRVTSRVRSEEAPDQVEKEIEQALRGDELGQLVREESVDDFLGLRPTSHSRTTSATPKRKLPESPHVPDKETLSDVEDDEIDNYLNTREEIKVKEGVWERINREYLAEQAHLEKLKTEDPEQYKRLRPWRVQKARVREREGMAATGTGERNRERRQSSKVNYAVLDDLFAGESQERAQ